MIYSKLKWEFSVVIWRNWNYNRTGTYLFNRYIEMFDWVGKLIIRWKLNEQDKIFEEAILTAFYNFISNKLFYVKTNNP